MRAGDEDHLKHHLRINRAIVTRRPFCSAAWSWPRRDGESPCRPSAARSQVTTLTRRWSGRAEANSHPLIADATANTRWRFFTNTSCSIWRTEVPDRGSTETIALLTVFLFCNTSISVSQSARRFLWPLGPPEKLGSPGGLFPREANGIL